MAEEEEEKEEESALNQARLDKMKANLARIYTAMDRYDDATNLYASLQESELSSVFGIALAHFKAGRHEESFFTYSAAQDWLTGDDEKLSHLKVSLQGSDLFNCSSSFKPLMMVIINGFLIF